MEWLNSLLRHFKIQTLLKMNCCMAAISTFRVTQHSHNFSLFFRNRIQCIALYKLHNSQALLNLRRGYYRNTIYLWKSLKSLGLPSKETSSATICLEKDGILSFDPKTNAEIFKDFYSNLANNLVKKLPTPPPPK